MKWADASVGPIYSLRERIGNLSDGIGSCPKDSGMASAHRQVYGAALRGEALLVPSGLVQEGSLPQRATYGWTLVGGGGYPP